MEHLLENDTFKQSTKKAVERFKKDTIFYLYINAHGALTPITLVSYGETSIDSLIINLLKKKEKGISMNDIIVKTVDFLEKETKIIVNGIFQDGQRGTNIGEIDFNIAISIQSLSNMFFEAFENLHVHEIDDLKVLLHSTPNAIQRAIASVQGLKSLIEENKAIFFTSFRQKGKTFNTNVFDRDVKVALFLKLKACAKDADEFRRSKKLFGGLLDFFEVLWKRKDLQNENELTINANEILEVLTIRSNIY